VSYPFRGERGVVPPESTLRRITVDSAVLVVEQDEEDLAEEAPVTEELLVEEISIDGMCGVY
jgi:mycofactocin precursor